jgi:hypothetical protein
MFFSAPAFNGLDDLIIVLEAAVNLADCLDFFAVGGDFKIADGVDDVADAFGKETGFVGEQQYFDKEHHTG